MTEAEKRKRAERLRDAKKSREAEAMRRKARNGRDRMKRGGFDRKG